MGEGVGRGKVLFGCVPDAEARRLDCMRYLGASERRPSSAMFGSGNHGLGISVAPHARSGRLPRDE